MEEEAANDNNEIVRVDEDTPIFDFEAAFEQVLQTLTVTKRVAESLDTVFQRHMGSLTYPTFYQNFQYHPHIQGLVDALGQNDTLARLSVPMDILSEEGAIYLGQTLARMESLQELTLVERSFANDPLIHVLLSQLDPELSKIARLRVFGRLQATPEIERLLSDSTSLLLLEANLSLISTEGDESISRLSRGLQHGHSVQDLVLHSTTWQRLAVVLRCIQHNPQISRLDLHFDMKVGEETIERNDAMLECMQLLGTSRHLHTLYIAESAVENFPRHSFYHTALADAIQVNSSIKILQMEGAIQQDGLTALSLALQVNSTIETLAFPSIRRGTVIPFAQGLGHMKGLKTVLFWGSQMLSVEEAEAIADGLCDNTSIWHFQFSYHARNPDLAKRIRHYLQLNEIQASKLVADAPIALMPHILTAADRRSISTLYTFVSARAGDLLYYNS